MAFKKGQSIVAVGDDVAGDTHINKDDLFTHLRYEKMPSYCSPCSCCGNNTEVMLIQEHPDCAWCPCSFAPLQYLSVGISKELAKSFTETLETSEVITKKLTENA